jgi:hypothetical protein
VLVTTAQKSWFVAFVLPLHGGATEHSAVSARFAPISKACNVCAFKGRNEPLAGAISGERWAPARCASRSSSRAALESVRFAELEWPFGLPPPNRPRRPPDVRPRAIPNASEDRKQCWEKLCVKCSNAG